jgi:hypothetical protein
MRFGLAEPEAAGTTLRSMSMTFTKDPEDEKYRNRAQAAETAGMRERNERRERAGAERPRRW